MSETHLLAGRYQLEELIGTGGMAMVYRATDTRTGHKVAVKILRPEFNNDEEFLTRFEREAVAASKMSHHNIVNLLDVGNENEQRYLVMEYVDGKTLKEVIKEKGRLAPETAVQIAIRILSALQHAHQNGIIHRDIKPQNILVNSEGHIKVSDFGIARMAEAGTISKGDSVMGSVYYFSPEQASGEDVSAASDIYSVGVVLYEMLTGQVPFTGDTPVSVAMQHLHQKAVPVRQLCPDVPPALSDVVMHAMEKDPSRRYQSALEMASDLKAAVNNEPLKYAYTVQERTASMHKVTPPAQKPIGRLHRIARQCRRWVRKHRAYMYTGATLALALAVLVGLGFGAWGIYSQVVSTVSAPDVRGYDQTAASRMLERVGLHAEIVTIHHATVPEGVVIGQTPEFDSSMKKGDTVVLSVSSGPSQLLVPNVMGQTYDDAMLTLQSGGLVITLIERVVSTEPVGTIIRQKPEADTACVAGDTIQVSISGGCVSVPDVTKIPYEDALSQLSAVGLNVSGEITYIPTQVPEENGLVTAISPEAGSQVIEGASVTLSVASYQKTYTTAVEITVPQSQNNLEVRVTLVNLSDEEVEQYASTILPADNRTRQVTLTAATPGVMTYHVYVDGAVSYTGTATLQ